MEYAISLLFLSYHPPIIRSVINLIPAYKDNYIWLLKASNNPRVAIVDPGDAKPVYAALTREKLTLSAILITHHHWDHTNGITELAQHYSVPVFGPALETIAGVTHLLKEGDCVEFPVKLQVLDIPGHTRGHIAYYGENMLFCGDTLFTGGCGRLFEGTVEQLYHSLNKLAALPDNTHVYCGHEYTEANLRFARAIEPHNTDLLTRIAKVRQLRAKNLPTVPSTLAEEKCTNPFLRCTVPAVIQAAEHYTGKKLLGPIQVFAALREWKNNF